MKSRVVSGFLLLLVAVTTVIGQTQSPQSQSYPFARYPADRLFTGKPAQPKLMTSKQRQFQTVLRNGAKKGPNFAGHYTVVEWGCGSNCVVFAVVDAVSGEVHEHNLLPVIRADALRSEVKSLRLQYKKQTLGPLTLSVGVAAFPEHGSTADELLKIADQCLYESKSRGRDIVTVALAQNA